MNNKYFYFHTSYKALGQQIIDLTKEYQNKTASEEDVAKALNEWKKNCPNLLFDDETQSTISAPLLRVIGKRRGMMILTVLRASVQ